ncbi:hypothetical protein [Labrys neptuniae]
MRVTMAAFLVGGLSISGLLAAGLPALATEKPPADKAAPASSQPTTPAAPKPAAPAKPRPSANQPVDYGDMRCGFAIRRHDVLDNQIIAWAGGYIEGYAKANPGHFGSERAVADITDPATLRTHIRGYCLKHRDKSLETAVLALVPRARGNGAATTPAPHPAQPAQHPAPK